MIRLRVCGFKPHAGGPSRPRGTPDHVVPLM